MIDLSGVFKAGFAFLIAGLVFFVVLYIVQAIFLSKLNKLLYDKGSALGWIPVANFYLLGKLCCNKIVGWVLVISLLLNSSWTTTINGVETTKTLLPGFVSKIIDIIFIGFYIFAIIKYFSIKKGNEKSNGVVNSGDSKMLIGIVSIIIALIFCLMGLLVYFVSESKKAVIDVNNKVSTTSSTTKTISSTTTTRLIQADVSIADSLVNNYYNNLLSDSKISEYVISNSYLLGKSDMCEDVIYDKDNIYYGISVSYKKIDDTYIVNDSEEEIDDGSYKLDINYIIGKVNGEYEIIDSFDNCR